MTTMQARPGVPGHSLAERGFMASLALALALCQIIQEQSGGISIDALLSTRALALARWISKRLLMLCRRYKN